MDQLFIFLSALETSKQTTTKKTHRLSLASFTFSSHNLNSCSHATVLSGQLKGADPYRPCPVLSLPVIIIFYKETSLNRQDCVQCRSILFGFRGPILDPFSDAYVSSQASVEQPDT